MQILLLKKKNRNDDILHKNMENGSNSEIATNNIEQQYEDKQKNDNQNQEKYYPLKRIDLLKTELDNKIGNINVTN